MSTELSPGHRNRILASLPPAVLTQLQPHLRSVTLVPNQVLYERGNPIEDVYFIESGIASIIAETFDEGGVAVGMTGREGLVGVPVLLTTQPLACQRISVHIPGHGLRISASAFLKVLELPLLRATCLNYVYSLLAQTAQIAACNARHDVTERLARCLAMTLDRTDGNILPLTQEFLAVMIGVRRTGVALSAGALQTDGLIRYSRGSIAVLDQAGLKAAACRCYTLLDGSRD